MPNKCQCGCGSPTGARFAVGHDARHKGNLIRKALKGDDSAVKELEERGWYKFLEKSRNAQARPKGMSRATSQYLKEKAEQEAEAVVDRYAAMKKAADRLRAVGRYGKSSKGEQILLTTENYQDILDATDDELMAMPATAAVMAG